MAGEANAVATVRRRGGRGQSAAVYLVTRGAVQSAPTRATALRQRGGLLLVRPGPQVREDRVAEFEALGVTQQRVGKCGDGLAVGVRRRKTDRRGEQFSQPMARGTRS